MQGLGECFSFGRLFHSMKSGRELRKRSTSLFHITPLVYPSLRNSDLVHEHVSLVALHNARIYAGAFQTLHSTAEYY
jgi:hypothetical protein